MWSNIAPGQAGLSRGARRRKSRANAPSFPTRDDEPYAPCAAASSVRRSRQCQSDGDEAFVREYIHTCMIRPAVSPNRTRYTFFVDPDQLAALRQIKQDFGIPESEQIRRALNEWLSTRDRRQKTAKPSARTPRKAKS